jgi:kelch-like protein 2/3
MRALSSLFVLFSVYRCTKQGHQKPLDSKDENPEKHCPLTVNPWHMKKAFKVMNELRR